MTGRAVLPHAPKAWYDPVSVEVGYEVGFNCYFYEPQSLRTLVGIREDIVALGRGPRGCWMKSSEALSNGIRNFLS